MRKAADGLAQLLLQARSLSACKKNEAFGNASALPLTHRAEWGSEMAMEPGQYWGYLSLAWEF